MSRVIQTLDYAAVPVARRRRYSRFVLLAFVAAIMLPAIAIDLGSAWLAALPWWVIVGVPAATLGANIAAAFHLLEGPDDVGGDRMVSWGVFVSGICLLASMFAMLASIH